MKTAFCKQETRLTTMMILSVKLVTILMWVVNDAKCVLVTRVCLCVCLQPHSHTTARTQM